MPLQHLCKVTISQKVSMLSKKQCDKMDYQTSQPDYVVRTDQIPKEPLPFKNTRRPEGPDMKTPPAL